MMKKRKVFVGIVILILIGALVIFHIPKEFQRTYSVSLQTGEEVRVIQIETNLHISKRLFTENKVNGNVTIQGNTFQINNYLEVGKFINVGQIIQKFKGKNYNLSEWYYDKGSNKLIRPLSIHISRDLETVMGTIIGKEQTDPSYFKSTE